MQTWPRSLRAVRYIATLFLRDLVQARVKIKTIAESSNNRLIALALSVLCCEGGRVLRRERVPSYWLISDSGGAAEPSIGFGHFERVKWLRKAFNAHHALITFHNNIANLACMFGSP
jgi:hypothetical protein